jgi:hypothetical protein
MRLLAVAAKLRADAADLLGKAQAKERELGFLRPDSERLPVEIDPQEPLLDFADVPGWVAADRAWRAEAAALDRGADLLTVLAEQVKDGR